VIRSDDAGDAWWRAELQAAGRARSHTHHFQACHFLGYDPAGGFPSPPTEYQRGRRAQNLSRSRTLRAREGLTFTSSSTMASLERRVEIPVYGRIGHDQQPVPIEVPIAKRSAASSAKRQGPKPAWAETRPSRGSGAPLRRRRACPRAFARGDAQMVRSARHYTIATNSDMNRNAT
jgi:hypothetical protein